MNITEANAVSTLIEVYLGLSTRDPEKLRADVRFLAGRVNKALMAGITPERVDAAWPNRLGAVPAPAGSGSRPCPPAGDQGGR